MSAGVINSSILLGLGIAVGLVSLAIQTFFWLPKDASIFSGMMKVFGDIWKEIVESITIWDSRNPEFRSISFTRMSVTFVLMLGLVALVLATYDSVSSFWIFFILYLGVGMLALPILGHLVSAIFRKKTAPSMMTSNME